LPDHCDNTSFSLTEILVAKITSAKPKKKMVQLKWQVLSLLLAVAAVAWGFRFDHDTGQNCKERTQDCSTDKTTYFQCPITCAKALEPESGATSSGPLNDEAFYDLQAKDANGKTVNFEKFEGYVTVIAAIPLLKGTIQPILLQLM
jgi:hypothetical protein